MGVALLSILLSAMLGTLVPGTTTAGMSAAVATPAPDVPFEHKLPRDEKGRIIGGLFPVLNYSSIMITSKPCPRVTKWEFEVVKMKPPLRDYGISNDPCVVQNAVDDLVRTLWFNPAFNTPETMQAVAKVYDTDPMNVDGVEETLRRSMFELYRQGLQNYNRCDRPVYRLLHVDAQAPLIANNDGRVSGQTIQIMLLRVAKDVSPFACEFVSYGDGTVKGRFAVTTADMRKPYGVRVNVFNLLWNPARRIWQVYSMDALPVLADYAAIARALLAASLVKAQQAIPDRGHHISPHTLWPAHNGWVAVVSSVL